MRRMTHIRCRAAALACYLVCIGLLNLHVGSQQMPDAAELDAPANQSPKHPVHHHG